MNTPRQSFSWWPFAHRGLPPAELLAGAAKIGFEGVDLLDEDLWPLAQKQELTIAAIGGHGSIESGFNLSENADRIEHELSINIGKAAKWNIPVVLCFAGTRGAMTDEAAWDQGVKTLGRVMGRAADAGVVVAMELLNSKVDHPGYMGDHTAWGVELCRRVGSPAMKLLYDIYHMQIMEGDLIRTIQASHSYIAHYHTAGVPGRGQPDASQEIFYPAVYRAIAATGYTGFISHEFVPEGDPLAALERAFVEAAPHFA